MDGREVVRSETTVLPTLPRVLRVRHKGVDQEVPGIPTPVIEDHEYPPILVHPYCREHLIHLQAYGVVIDTHGRRPRRPPVCRAGEENVPETVAREGGTATAKNPKGVRLAKVAAILPGDVDVTSRVLTDGAVHSQ